MTEASCDIMVCDALARTLLPQLRAEMVQRLVSHYGVSQSEVAKKLNVSRAAISQYMSRKRGGTRMPISDELDMMIDLWAHAVMYEDQAITLCDICRCANREEISTFDLFGYK
ncbi:MAG: helix-turn-helix domain-containing protein [Methanomicrobiaceae archaeon]|nr:helix-turn-helix domain-containing protein [Methanomicrobiaceae archaeon]